MKKKNVQYLEIQGTDCTAHISPGQENGGLYSLW